MHKSRMKHHLLCVALLFASPLCHADRLLACRLSLEQTHPVQGCLSLYPADSPQRTLADGTIHPRIARRLRYDKDGLAVVLTDEAYFYVNRKLKVRSTITFDNGADYFEQGLARTRQNNKIGFFDKSLKIVIPAAHTFVFPFENDRADACDGCITEMIDGGEHSIMTGGTWGWIDRKGHYTPQKTDPEK